MGKKKATGRRQGGGGAAAEETAANGSGSSMGRAEQELLLRKRIAELEADADPQTSAEDAALEKIEGQLKALDNEAQAEAEAEAEAHEDAMPPNLARDFDAEIIDETRGVEERIQVWEVEGVAWSGVG